MNVQYLDFCVRAEGSNFAIWSSKWTTCDINVEIKKYLHKPVLESFLICTCIAKSGLSYRGKCLEPTSIPTMPALVTSL